jgi:hypothetical protein
MAAKVLELFDLPDQRRFGRERGASGDEGLAISRSAMAVVVDRLRACRHSMIARWAFSQAVFHNRRLD